MGLNRTFFTILFSFLLIHHHSEHPVVGAISLKLREDAITVKDGTNIIQGDQGDTYVEPDGSVTFISRPALDDQRYGQRGAVADGWQTSAWTFGTEFTYMSAKWRVPPNPTVLGSQVLFYFISTEAADNNNILQPVLQFQQLGTGTGWSYASWSCNQGQCAHTDFVPVVPGDLIYGVLSNTPSGYAVLGYVNGVLRGNLTVSTTSLLTKQTAAQWALEVYYADSCAEFPPSNTLTATEIVMKDQNVTYVPSWSDYTYQSTCNVVSSGTQNTATVSWSSSPNTPVVTTTTTSTSTTSTTTSTSSTSTTSSGTGSSVCKLTSSQAVQNSWAQGGSQVTQYSITITNPSTTKAISSLRFRFSGPASQVWSVTANNDGTYDLPTYANGLAAGKSFTFGYVAATQLSLSVVACTGGDPSATVTSGTGTAATSGGSGSTPTTTTSTSTSATASTTTSKPANTLTTAGTLTSTTTSSGSATSGGSSTSGGGGKCSTIRLDQTVASSWSDQSGVVTQFNVALVNTGSKAITSIEISAGSRSSSITQTWSINVLPNNNYGLPSWARLTANGGSISWGYVVKGTSPVAFATVAMGC